MMWMMMRKHGESSQPAKQAELAALQAQIDQLTTALLFFVYLGYLALRRTTFDRVDRARRSATSPAAQAHEPDPW